VLPVTSITRSTDGTVSVDGKLIIAGARTRRDNEGAWVHPHERIGPMGSSEMSEWGRRSWGKV